MKSRRETYLKLSPEPWEAYGFSDDGLLFACLLAVGQNREFDIESAINTSTGQLFRNPGLKRGAPLGPGSSTISRDMVMGFLVYCLHFRKLHLLESAISYALRNFLKIGKENKVHTFVRFGLTVKIKDNRTILTPGLLFLMLAIRAYLKGQSLLLKFLLTLPQIYSTGPGYVSHLTLLHLYLNRRMRGYSTPPENTVLSQIRKHMALNPFLLLMQGEKQLAEDSISIWPVSFLPTYDDWTEGWRLQRSDDDSGFHRDLGNFKKHSGGDLLFVEHLKEILDAKTD